ncbi:MAG: hypothetical protein FRX48_04011 [Lasallia pustulata]|uniref:Uncharacterized protein n=1 Tax=Lasallia pustulata TaxID=136370 RepID=A0A5M8PQR3_9LECA|nr:MAG: hypothetical protein FRX48_04011 [Lasallia pustulata]
MWTTFGRGGGKEERRKVGKRSTSAATYTLRKITSRKGGGNVYRERQKPSHTAIGCPVSMRVVRHRGSVTVDCVSKAQKHNHSLDDCDRFKRPSVFRVLAAREVANGYAVAEVAKNLRAVNRSEDRKKLFAAGGKWLTAKDVHNACTAWKNQNPVSRQQGDRLAAASSAGHRVPIGEEEAGDGDAWGLGGRRQRVGGQ